MRSVNPSTLPFAWACRPDAWISRAGSSIAIASRTTAPAPPLSQASALFRTFIDLPLAGDAAAGFARRYGFLGDPAVGQYDESGLRVDAELIADWTRHRDELSKAWSARDDVAASATVIGEAFARLAGDHLVPAYMRLPSGGYYVGAGPVTLLGAMWLQLAEVVAGHRELRQCASCGSWHELSPDVARTNRRYCGQSCRSQAYYGRRRRALELHSGGMATPEIATALGATTVAVEGWIAKAEVRETGED